MCMVGTVKHGEAFCWHWLKIAVVFLSLCCPFDFEMENFKIHTVSVFAKESIRACFERFLRNAIIFTLIDNALTFECPQSDWLFWIIKNGENLHPVHVRLLFQKSVYNDLVFSLGLTELACSQEINWTCLERFVVSKERYKNLHRRRDSPFTALLELLYTYVKYMASKKITTEKFY